MQLVANLHNLFSSVSGKGCLIIEQENGPDNYIENVRRDAFERFNLLIDTVK